MATPDDGTAPDNGTPQRTAFLLSQLGSLSSDRFAERTRKLGLTPGDAGTLRLIGRTPGLSQRALATRLGSLPSRVVQLIDSLEGRGLVERARSSTDRRNYELHLTAEGRSKLRELRTVSEAHEQEMLAALSPDQSAELARLLSLLAQANHADPDVHRET
ncbi:MarR family winged helix-turn-helix transcriptional regulator [Arthrobacter dokdonensis]|uniref:MarR family winged helix-turn-helix transcriptional regulator n=1 Tax=Arthrobacter dokdonellae TaxID=2211210 RepID=UPI000DE5A287|nr:MarR family transcriptional regulator [Arthrobacter dokdonellae]